MTYRPSFAPVLAIVKKIAPIAYSNYGAGVFMERNENEPWRGWLSVNALDFESSCQQAERMGLIASTVESGRQECAIAENLVQCLARDGIKARQCRNTSMVEFSFHPDQNQF